MKKNGWLVFIFVLIVGFYFGYKGICLYQYNVQNYTDISYREFVSRFKFKNTMVLETQELKADEYLEFQGIKIRNDFKDY